MAYFEKFPLVLYDAEGTGDHDLITHILKRVEIRESTKSNRSVYFSYEVDDGDSPEIIAHKLYGDATLHWVVLLMNDMLNPYYDFPLSQQKLEKYIFKKYPGVSLFMKDYADTGLASISLSGINTLTITELSFLNIEGDTKSIHFDSGDTIRVGSVITEVWDWDKTLRRLNVYDPKASRPSDLNSAIGQFDSTSSIIIEDLFVVGDSTFELVTERKARIGTRNTEELFGLTAVAAVNNHGSLHHFEDSVDGNITLDNIDSVDRIGGYISSLQADNVNPPEVLITNEFYEERTNDLKRKIKLLKPEFIGHVVTELDELLNA